MLIKCCGGSAESEEVSVQYLLEFSSSIFRMCEAAEFYAKQYPTHYNESHSEAAAENLRDRDVVYYSNICKNKSGVCVV